MSERVWTCSRTTAAVSPGTAGSCTGPGCFLATAGKPRCGSTWGSSRSVPGSSSGRCCGCWRSPSSRCWAPTRSAARWWRWRSPGRPSSPGWWRDASPRPSRSAPGTSWRTCWSGWPCSGCNCPGRRAGKSPRLWRWPASSERGLCEDRTDKKKRRVKRWDRDKWTDLQIAEIKVSLWWILCCHFKTLKWTERTSMSYCRFKSSETHPTFSHHPGARSWISHDSFWCECHRGPGQQAGSLHNMTALTRWCLSQRGVSVSCCFGVTTLWCHHVSSECGIKGVWSQTVSEASAGEWCCLSKVSTKPDIILLS